MKYGPPTDAAVRRERDLQIHNQRQLETEIASRLLRSDGLLQDWERDFLVQLAQELRPWQEGTRSAIDNRLSLDRAARVDQLRRRHAETA